MHAYDRKWERARPRSRSGVRRDRQRMRRQAETRFRRSSHAVTVTPSASASAAPHFVTFVASCATSPARFRSFRRNLRLFLHAFHILHGWHLCCASQRLDPSADCNRGSSGEHSIIRFHLPRQATYHAG
jgi:hypothetical protein